MQAFVITAYKDYEAPKTPTLALSRRGLCVIHATRRGSDYGAAGGRTERAAQCARDS